MIWSIGNTIQIGFILVGIILQWLIIEIYDSKISLIWGTLVSIVFNILGTLIAISG